MNNFNSMVMIGRMVSDGDLKDTGKTYIYNNTIAVNKKYKGEEQTVYLDITAYGKLAQHIDDTAGKGSEVSLSGELAQSTWKDKNTGDKRSKLYMKVEKYTCNSPFKNRNDDRRSRHDDYDDRDYHDDRRSRHDNYDDRRDYHNDRRNRHDNYDDRDYRDDRREYRDDRDYRDDRRSRYDNYDDRDYRDNRRDDNGYRDEDRDYDDHHSKNNSFGKDFK